MAHIPPETIEQVAAANDIVDVIGSYFPLKRMGLLYKALCPFHQERTPSFTVNSQRQTFKCFGCNAGGSVFRFVMDYEHIDFPSAVRKLADKAGITIVEAVMSPEDIARGDMRKRLLALHAEAADFFHAQLLRSQAAGHARDYLKKRGLTAEVAKSWKIGYAPDQWDSLFNHCEANGFTHDEITQSGLFSKSDKSDRLYDRFRDRIMFPICNDTGEVIAFSGRILDAEKSPAKYVNSPETMLFTKGNVLFGLHKSKRALIEKKSAIVCEGQIDLITAFEAGVQNVIAPQGTAFTERQAHILKRYSDEVVLCFDADAAGEKAAERSLPFLLGETLTVRIMEMPPGEDPDSMIRKQGAAAFLERVAQARDFFDFQIEREARRENFNTPTGKMKAARKLMDFVAMIPEPVLREVVLNNVSTRLELSTEVLKTLIKAPGRSANLQSTTAPVVPEADKLSPTLEFLVLLALRDPVSRIWLQSRGWNRVLEEDPRGRTLLMTVLEAEVNVENPASITRFLATLPPPDETLVSALLAKQLPPDAQRVAEDCWHRLERDHLTRLQAALQSKLHSAGLSAAEEADLAGKIIATQKQLAALPLHTPKLPEN